MLIGSLLPPSILPPLGAPPQLELFGDHSAQVILIKRESTVMGFFACTLGSRTEMH